MDEQPRTALLGEWPSVRGGPRPARRESDASLMLGLVLLVIAATLVLGAAAGAVALIVA